MQAPCVVGNLTIEMARKMNLRMKLTLVVLRVRGDVVQNEMTCTEKFLKRRRQAKSHIESKVIIL